MLWPSLTILPTGPMLCPGSSKLVRHEDGRPLVQELGSGHAGFSGEMPRLLCLCPVGAHLTTSDLKCGQVCGWRARNALLLLSKQS